ncbi:MAG: crossover junction endodeoxyribonuclease RuvC [Spirochaetales bacterium]|nr:crossover junction endodeoxyribonuclease RuvC [Spirochaetales bacterium]
MVILGIDPGLAQTGWGIVAAEGQKFKLLSYGVIKTDKAKPLEVRIFSIVKIIEDLIKKYDPSDISIEDIYFFKNISSAIPIAKVIGAIGVAAMNHNLKFRTFTPLQIKTALTGIGRAEKHQIQEMVRLLLSLKEIPRPDHAADALAAGICYYNHSISNQRIK